MTIEPVDLTPRRAAGRTAGPARGATTGYHRQAAAASITIVA